MTQQPEKPVVPTASVQPDEEVSNFDKSDPRSLFNLLPRFLQDRLEQIPAEFFEFTEDQIRQQLFGNEAPDQTTNRLRVAFWEEYDRVQRYKENILKFQRICEGVCTPAYFMKKVVPDDKKLVWLLHQPSDYNITLHEIHELGLRQLRNVLCLPILDERGRPNTRLIEVQNKIFQHIDMRLKGGIVQRTDQRNLNINGQLTPEQTAAAAASIPPPKEDSMAEIELRLAALKQRSTLLEAPSVIQAVLEPASPTPERILSQAESLPIPDAELVPEAADAKIEEASDLDVLGAGGSSADAG